jgi:hypothetical protein
VVLLLFWAADSALWLLAARIVQGVAVQLHSAFSLFAGTVIAWLASGAAFNGSMAALCPLARPHERAGYFQSARHQLNCRQETGGPTYGKNNCSGFVPVP